MVGHDVDDDLDAARVSRSDHVIEVVKRAETWVDIAVVRHIIAAIDKRRRVKRAQPDGLDTQPLKIVHLLGNARDIAQTRTSRILKRARVDLIDRGIGHPRARRRLFCSHGAYLPCNEVMRDAHDDTPKADIRDKQRHSHAPKRSPPLGFKPPGTNRPISEKNGRPTFPATTASGLRVPQVAAKEEGSVLYVRDRRLRGKMGCPGLAQRQQKTRFVRTA